MRIRIAEYSDATVHGDMRDPKCAFGAKIPSPFVFGKTFIVFRSIYFKNKMNVVII